MREFEARNRTMSARAQLRDEQRISRRSRTILNEQSLSSACTRECETAEVRLAWHCASTDGVFKLCPIWKACRQVQVHQAALQRGRQLSARRPRRQSQLSPTCCPFASLPQHTACSVPATQPFEHEHNRARIKTPVSLSRRCLCSTAPFGRSQGRSEEQQRCSHQACLHHDKRAPPIGWAQRAP